MSYTFSSKLSDFFWESNSQEVFLAAVSNKVESVRVFIPTGIYLFKVKNRNTRTMCEMCSRLKIKTLERRQYRGSEPSPTLKMELFFRK